MLYVQAHFQQGIPQTHINNSDITQICEIKTNVFSVAVLFVILAVSAQLKVIIIVFQIADRAFLAEYFESDSSLFHMLDLFSNC